VAFIDDDCWLRPDWLLALTSGVSLSPPRATGETTFNGLVSNAYARVSHSNPETLCYEYDYDEG